MKRINYYEVLIWSFVISVMLTMAIPAKAQVVPCDSIEYAITSTPNNNVLQLEGWVNGICPVNFPCVVSDWSWSVCDDNLCYSDTGTTVYFQQFMTTDTIKVCLTTFGDLNGITFTCTQCDSLVFGPNGWMLMNMGNPTGINELQFTWEDDGKVYDLIGREVTQIQIGQMYIRNNKKYIRIK
jgi:hypothetical protein